MSLIHQVLGLPGGDNALMVRVETGQRISRLLFDCGDGCLDNLSFSEIQSIDQLFFSHLHMDHVGGFDSFFRCTFDRVSKPNIIWGPPGTSGILHHRLQGFLWNLVEGQNATWRVNDVSDGAIEQYRYELSDAFSTKHFDGAIPGTAIILDDPDFTVEAIHLNHHGPCVGYLVREKPKRNVNKERYAELGFQPGPWMKTLKDNEINGEITVEGKVFSLDKLRSDLIVESKGESVAYLTDFLLDDHTFSQLSKKLQNCQTVVCEAQYRDQDLDLARRNHHTTTTQVARLAADANIGELLLFHLSNRYTVPEWNEMLVETRSLFERSAFPPSWNMTLQGNETRNS